MAIRIREPFYDVMTCLTAKNLLNPDALHSDIEWEKQSGDLMILMTCLQSFEVAEQCSAMGMDQLHDSFHGPVSWLANTGNSPCDYRHQRRRSFHRNVPHSWCLRQRSFKRSCHPQANRQTNWALIETPCGIVLDVTANMRHGAFSSAWTTSSRKSLLIQSSITEQ